jgi:putative acetyltransferase
MPAHCGTQAQGTARPAPKRPCAAGRGAARGGTAGHELTGAVLHALTSNLFGDARVTCGLRDNGDRLVQSVAMYYCRPEHAADAGAIHALHSGAFPTTAEARLVDALRAGGRLAVSIVAVDAREVVGHIAFSPVTAGSASGLGLAPMAVGAAHRRQGVGAMLVREGLASCSIAGCGFVVVLGDPRYYGRFGFGRASERGLGNEYGVDEEFMVLELRSGSLPDARAIVRYAPEFALVEGIDPSG